MSHTPGKWKPELTEVKGVGVFIRILNEEKLIARLAWNKMTLKEVKANSRLIAAAPKMLAALLSLPAIHDGRVPIEQLMESLHDWEAEYVFPILSLLQENAP